MAAQAMDSVARFEALCKYADLPEHVWDCFLERGYDTASNFAFSIPDAEGLEMAIRMILRDDPAPMGNAAENRIFPTPRSKMHAAACKHRRIYAEAKNMSNPRSPGFNSCGLACAAPP